MNELTKEYIVLGTKVRLNTGENANENSAEKIVSRVQAEAEKLKKSSPNLDEGKIFLLVALKMAEEKIELEKEFALNVKQLETSAADALNLIDEVAPTTFV